MGKANAKLLEELGKVKADLQASVSNAKNEQLTKVDNAKSKLLTAMENAKTLLLTEVANSRTEGGDAKTKYSDSSSKLEDAIVWSNSDLSRGLGGIENRLADANFKQTQLVHGLQKNLSSELRGVEAGLKTVLKHSHARLLQQLTRHNTEERTAWTENLERRLIGQGRDLQKQLTQKMAEEMELLEEGVGERLEQRLEESLEKQMNLTLERLEKRAEQVASGALRRALRQGTATGDKLSIL